ncbi:MAG: Npun_R1517 family heterocyst differentiation transcriptional regulator [Phormidesmis sp.]
MDSSTNRSSLSDSDVGIYECEVRLKFRIIEEQMTMSNQDELIETLVDAFAYGNDEYLEALDSQVDVEQLQDVDKASPKMRRQLIRLRNSSRLA